MGPRPCAEPAVASRLWSMACDVSMVHGLCLYLCGCPDARTCPVSCFERALFQGTAFDWLARV